MNGLCLMGWSVSVPSEALRGDLHELSFWSQQNGSAIVVAWFSEVAFDGSRGQSSQGWFCRTLLLASTTSAKGSS